MLKIYGQWASRAFRVAWLCKESNIPYEHVPVTIYAEDASAKALASGKSVEATFASRTYVWDAERKDGKK